MLPEASLRSQSGRGYRRFVEREFQRFIERGAALSVIAHISFGLERPEGCGISTVGVAGQSEALQGEPASTRAHAIAGNE